MAEEIRKAGSMMICSRLILYTGVIIILTGTIHFQSEVSTLQVTTVPIIGSCYRYCGFISCTPSAGITMHPYSDYLQCPDFFC